jgi:hypothetical protein
MVPHMSSQPPEHALKMTGYLKRVSIERVFDEHGNERIDVELVLTKASQAGTPEFAVRFVGSRNIIVGDGHSGIDASSYFLLSVWDVSQDGWDGIKYRAANLEHGCHFSLYCRSFESAAV